MRILCACSLAGGSSSRDEGEQGIISGLMIIVFVGRQEHVCIICACGLVCMESRVRCGELSAAPGGGGRARIGCKASSTHLPSPPRGSRSKQKQNDAINILFQAQIFIFI